MRVLAACEFSGVVRDVFRGLGHEAWSCDLLPSDVPEYHIQGDVLEILKEPWDLVIAFPPCTYLARSGLHWNKRVEGRQALTDSAAEFFMEFTRLDCPWAIENPVGAMSRLYRKPDQIVSPYEFGHDVSKKTCLWLNGVPKLTLGERVEPRWVDGKPRWGNQGDSGQCNVSGGKTRGQRRSITFRGIAEAMGRGWGI